MSYTTIRTHGTTYARQSVTGRNVAYLSDGSVLVGFLDANESDTTGDGGDSTAISKLYIYYNNNVRGGWTLKNTITIGPGAANNRAEYWAMAVDANNNLHIAYVKKSDQSVQYVSAPYTTPGGVPTWTPAAAVVATAAPGAGINHTRIDIDCIGTGSANPVVVSYRNNTNSTGSISIDISVKNNSAAWVTTNWMLVSGAGSANATDDVSVACSTEASPDGTGYHYAAVSAPIATAIPSTYSAGIYMRAFQINLTTGAVVSQKDLIGNIFVGLAIQSRCYYMGSVGGVKSWAIAGYRWGATYDDNTSPITWSGMATLANDGTTVAVTHPIDYAWNRSNKAISKATYLNNSHSPNKTDKALIHHYADKSQTGYSRTVVFSTTMLLHGSCLEDDSSASALIGSPYGCAGSRNTDYRSCDAFYLTDDFKLVWVRRLVHGMNSAVYSPASGATIQTNKPPITPQYNLGYTNPPRYVRTQYQIATDAGFTANVRDIIEDNSRYIFVYGSSGSTYIVGNTLDLPVSLYSGTWYVRSRLLSAFGEWGPWITLASPWTVAHLPVGANLQPGGNVQIALYGLPTTFSWTFTDPAPGDVQTAYQVVVENVADGVSVYDSGKVTSAATAASTTIPLAYKDSSLRWKLQLWDQDNVAGGFISSGGIFVVTDVPTPSIMNPPAGVIGTGTPTLQWSTGIAAAKYQSAYRYTISSGSTILYDSGNVQSSATSVITPPGILSNNTSYTYTLYVKDNYGIEGVTTVSVQTNYAMPGAPASGYVYLFEYSKRGFVYISVDPTGYDTDFQSYNLYRRKIGTTSWELINIWSNSGTRMVHQDFTAATDVTYEYSVTQIVNRYGDRIESARTTLRTVTPSDDKYWLFSHSDASKSFPIYSVTDEAYTDEYESETYNIIGRGRHTDYGDRLGLSGQLTAKFRDRMLTGVAKVNYAKNPQMIVRATNNGDPTNWTSGGNGSYGIKTTSFQSTVEPVPTGATEALVITASALGTAVTDYVEVTQSLSRADQPWVAGDVVTMSVWVGNLPAQVNMNIILQNWNSSNGIISTLGDQVTLNPVEYYFPAPSAGSPDYGAGLPNQYWARYSYTGTLPAAFDHMVVYVRMRGTGAGTAGLTKSLIVAGAQWEKAGAATAYIDGDQIGGIWRGDNKAVQSETTGFYTARQAKQAVEEFKLLREFGYLRNPFGDVYTVSLGDASVSRIAGVAKSEFVDVTIPYTEVAF